MWIIEYRVRAKQALNSHPDRGAGSGGAPVRCAIGCSLALVLFSLCACGGGSGGSRGQSANGAMMANPRPMPPKPRPGPLTPSGARANALVLQVAAKPRDTNANKYPDLIEVMANLFAQPHPMPVHEDGVFVFQLFPGGRSDDPTATPLREWRVQGEALQQAKVVNPLFGATYQFSLSLLENGTDRLPLMAADLVAWFEPATGGDAVVRRQVHTMQVGAAESRP